MSDKIDFNKIDWGKIKADWGKIDKTFGNYIKENPCLDLINLIQPSIGSIPVVDHAAETAALRAKFGESFEPDFTDSKVIGRWKPDTSPSYRRRWNGEKYVYEEIK